MIVLLISWLSLLLLLLIIIIIIIIESCWQHRVPWVALTIRSYHPLLLEGPLDGISCLHRADTCKSLLVSKYWCIPVQESIREHYLYIHPYFTCRALFIFLGWFVRWEVSGCTYALLLDAASRIYLKQHLAFLSCSYFLPPSVSLEIRWCICTVVLTQPQLGRISEIRFPYGW